MKLQTLSLIIVALMLSACGKKSSSGSTRINRYNGNIAGQGTSTCNTNSWGRIYNNNSNDSEFRQTVANFTLYSLEEIGNISPYYNSNSTGIEFQMTLAFSGGQLANGSKAGFKITDSLVGTPSNDGSTVLPIQFVMQGRSGAGANGQFDAQVGDTKGYVRFVGARTSQQMVEGQVYFYNNGMNNSETYLGQFVVQSCAVTGI